MMATNIALPDVERLAYDKARNALSRSFPKLSKTKLVSFMREGQWWKVKVKFQERIYQDEMEDYYTDADFVYRWNSKIFQIAIQDNRPVILGYGETVVLTSWKEAYLDY